MRPWPRSLRSRVVLLTVGPLAVMILLSGWATRRASERSIENALRGSLSDAGSVLLEMIDARRQTLLMQAEVIAQDPRFQEAFSGGGTAFAAASGDGLENVAQEYLSITDADFLEVVDRGGQHLARATRRREDLDGWTDVGPGHASLSEALEGLGSTDFFVSDAGPTLVADVPVFVEGRLAVVLRLGQVLDRDFVLEVARLTSAAVVVAQDGLVLAEAMTGPDLPAPDLIASLLPRPSPIPRVHPSISPVIRLKLDGHDWLEVEVRLPGLHEDGGFSTHLARDLRTEFAPVARAHRSVLGLGLLLLAASAVGGVRVARGVTAPLRALVDALRTSRWSEQLPTHLRGGQELTELELALDERWADWRQRQNRQEDIERLRSRVLALTGRGLRAALDRMQSANERAQAHTSVDSSSELTDTHELVAEQLRRIESVTQDARDLVTLEQDPHRELPTELVDLGALVHRVVSEQSVARSSRAVELHLEIPSSPIRVPADPRLLGRAVRALLDNAVRFTPDGGDVGVEVSSAGDGRARVKVIDAGIGIAEADVRRIFRKCFEGGDPDEARAGDLCHGTRGPGLGLALVRSVARAHHGSIHVESQPGRGSCFTLEMPHATVPPSPAEPASTEESDLVRAVIEVIS